jgi:general secretion pathway protein G
MKRTNKSGFTLVEILIVVIILGILAAIVIPQFTNASQDARKSSLASQLQTLRSQIELYKLQHKDLLPDITGGDDTPGSEDYSNWDLLTTRTDADGVASTATDAFGPYMQAPPKNPLNGLAKVENGDATAAGFTVPSACGFVYDYNAAAGTGKIFGTDATGTAIFVE